MFYRNYKIFLIFSLIAFLMFFLIELFYFKERILSFQNYNLKTNSNIVILTGGTNRIRDGLKIIDNFKISKNTKFKILVSGTGKGYTKHILKKQLEPGFYPNLIECCIELDSISKNTFTNASETFKWTKRNNIKEFILITSNYHMPRAILEFETLMPKLQIALYPITPKKHNIEDWLGSYQTFILIFKEFCKYIIANLRIKFSNYLNIF